MRKKYKKLISSVLCSALAVTMISTSVPMASAAVKQSVITTSVTETPLKTSSGRGSYSLDEINANYLLPKSDDKATKDADKVNKTQIVNADDNPLTQQEDIFNYEEFGFDTSIMDKDIQNVANNTAYDDPLKNASLIVPNELLITSMNRGDDHKGEILNYDEQTSMDDTNNIDGLTKSSNTISLSEGKSGQTHNTIGIDYDGDGVDELAYNSLYADDNGKMSIRTYERKSNSDGSMASDWQEKSTQSIKTSNDDEILDIEAQNSKGYTSMTAGDFDNDGCEELAAYFPMANNGTGKPFVGIINIDTNGVPDLNGMQRIYLSDCTGNSDINNLETGDDLYDGYRMPVVGLSTTSIRANGATDNTKSYDDLVINVSIPRCYTDDNDNMNSSVAVYSMGSDKMEQNLLCDLRGDSTRMVFNNSVDADLNGDGYKELVVAGWYESGIGSNKSSGTISKNEALVQLISWNGTKYELVWGNDDPSTENGMKKVSFAGNLELKYNQEPIALTAGHYSPVAPLTQDFICVNGTISKCSGATVYANKVTGESNIADTAPFHDKTNYVGTSENPVEFVSVYAVDIHNNGCDAGVEQFISTADTGMYLSGSSNDVIVMLCGDTVDGMKDKINYHIEFVYCDNAGQWHEYVNKDYMDTVNEDDNGTSLSVCFADTDSDKTYYRYKGKSVGYSSPTLYSVIQVPPYYKEVNSANSSYTVSCGYTDGTKGTWGFGYTIGASVTVELGIPKLVEGAVSLAGSIGANYAGYSLATNTVDTSITLNVQGNSDYAIVFATPIVYNYYDQWVPTDLNGNGKWQTICSTQTLKPVFTNISIEDYNKLAGDMWVDYQNAKKDNKDKDIINEYKDLCNSAPVVENLPKSEAGNVNGYYNESEFFEYFNVYSDIDVDSKDKDHNEKYGIVSTEVKSDETMKGSSEKVSFSSKTEMGHGFDIKGSITESITAKEGVIFTTVKEQESVTTNFGGGCTWISSNSNGFSLSASFNPISTKNENIIYDSDENNSYSTINKSTINHYDADDYRYTANLVGFRTEKLNSYQNVDNVDGDDNGSGINRNDVYILSFYVSDGTNIPAELPEYVGVRDIQINDNGNYDITLSWRTTMNNESRVPNAYNLYVKEVTPGSEYFLVNKDAPIYRDKNQTIMNYTVEIPKDSNTNSYSFFLTSAKKVDSTGLSYIESAPSRVVTVNPSQALNMHGTVITNQPEIYACTKNNEEVTFSVEAYDESGLKLSYSWQKFNSDTNEWESIKGETSNTYTFTATSENEYTPIRCAISKSTGAATNIVVYSDIVTYYNLPLRGSKLVTGDVNADSYVNIYDATEIQRYAALIREYTKDLNFSADINGDGEIDIKDVTYLQNLLSEINA